MGKISHKPGAVVMVVPGAGMLIPVVLNIIEIQLVTVIS